MFLHPALPLCPAAPRLAGAISLYTQSHGGSREHWLEMTQEARAEQLGTKSPYKSPCATLHTQAVQFKWKAESGTGLLEVCVRAQATLV